VTARYIDRANSSVASAREMGRAASTSFRI
jgi:hypothetical protein